MKKMMYAAVAALFALSLAACDEKKNEPAQEQPNTENPNGGNDQQSGENGENGENGEGGEGGENGGSTEPEVEYLVTVADLNYEFDEFDAVDEGAGKTWKPVYYTNGNWNTSNSYTINKSNAGIAIELNQTGQNNAAQAQFRFQCKSDKLALSTEKSYHVVLKVKADNRSDRSQFKVSTVALGQAGYKNTANMMPVKVENQSFDFDVVTTLFDETFTPENEISDAFLCFTIGQNGNTTLNITEFSIVEVDE